MSTACGRLPRPNPCLPCLVGNPKRTACGMNPGERADRATVRRLAVQAARLRRDGKIAAAMRIEQRVDDICAQRPDLEDAAQEGLEHGSFSDNPRRKVEMPCGHLVVPDRVRPDWCSTCARLEKLERKRLGDNPKLMVVNPGDPMVAACERVLRRRLSTREKNLLSVACREFKTFHGRAARPSDVIAGDVPPGSTPIVWGMGVEERKDYVVPIESHRKGKWTHKAGDQGGRRHTKAPWVGVCPGRKRHNEVTVEVRGTKRYVKPTHGIMG